MRKLAKPQADDIKHQTAKNAIQIKLTSALIQYDISMTVYEQIQAAIDYVEQDLGSVLSCHEAARQAHMSLRSFYNYFWALTGFRYGEYVRKRRLSEAADKLSTTQTKIIDLAMEHGYESHEAFSRAFKEEYGESPQRFRTGRHVSKHFGAITIIKEQNMNLAIKHLPRMQAVSYQAHGPQAEGKTHDRIWDWALANGYGDLYGEANIRPYRLFGHNLPGTADAYKLYLTISDESLTPSVLQSETDLVLEYLEPGHFAVLGVEGDVSKDWRFIQEGWRRLETAATESGHQLKPQGRCFEEKLEPVIPGMLRLDLYLELM